MSDSALHSADHVNTYDAWVNDPRGVISTGFAEMDALLRKGGVAPATLVLLGGRTGTRKTTTGMNILANMLDQDVPCGLIGLDGGLANNYLGRLFSIRANEPMEQVEATWNNEKKQQFKEEYRQWAKNLSIYNGPPRPSPTNLSEWLLECELPSHPAERPQVVFIDYVSLLHRRPFSDQQRIPQLIEELQVWTTQHEVVSYVVHQVGRMDEGVALRYHGDTPMSLAGLKYGGEEIADIVLATYRPAKELVGNMTFEMAKRFKGEKFTFEDYEQAQARVERYWDYTFLQLLKNRPGVHLNEKGIPLRQQDEGMKMHVDMSILETEDEPWAAAVDPGDTARAFGGEADGKTEIAQTHDEVQAQVATLSDPA